MEPQTSPQSSTQPETERREITVTDPDLSPATRREIVHDVREVIGADHVTVPVDRPHPSEGGEATASSHAIGAVWSTNKLLPVVVIIMFTVIGALLTATTGSWWFMALAFAFDVAGVAVLVRIVLRMTSIQERPEPTTVAAMEHDGIVNPEQRFSEIVAEYTPQSRGDESSGNGRDTAVEDDPLKAGAEQSTSTTSTSGASRPVGPGSH